MGVNSARGAPSPPILGKFHNDAHALAQTSGIRRWRLASQIAATRPLVAALEEIAGRYAATPAQVALNWLIHFQGETVVAIPGASKVHQAEEAAGAMKFRLTDEEMDILDDLSSKLQPQ